MHGTDFASPLPYLRDGRIAPQHQHIKTQSKQKLVRLWTFDLDIEPTHGHPDSCRARPVNIKEDGLEDIMWIRGLGARGCPPRPTLFAQT